MKIFIGSSNEAIEGLELIASWIEEYGHEPIPWNDLQVFAPGSYTFSGIVEMTRKADAAIFIFSEDDRVWYRSDTAKQPRDNVMIEYGLFLGALGQKRVIFCRKGKPKAATDLLGVVYVDISENRKAAAKRQLRAWVSMINEEEHEDELILPLERLRSPFQALGKRTLFLCGTEMLKGANRRVALVARTPISIVGTRPYGEKQHVANYEKEQFECFWQLMEHSLREGKPQIRCVACAVGISEELKNINSTMFRQTIIRNLEKYYIYVEKNSECQLCCSRFPSSLTYLVADNDFIIWFKDGAGESVWITANNDSVADALYDMTTRNSDELTLNDFLQRLGLH